MHPARTPGGEELELWYALGRLYSRTASAKSRATRFGFTAALISGALVLLSAPLFGRAWAGPFAPAIPVILGLLAGLALLVADRTELRRGEASLRRALSGRGLDPRRPASEGLKAYYDAQLILLRSEYEYLRLRGVLRTARILEQSFGFTPEDPFEIGPLNVAPDTEEMRELRERWERRISMRRERGMTPPALGLREDLAYRVFPREMTVPAELATREAYLTISRNLLLKRYGRNPHKKAGILPEALRERAERDLREHAELTGKPSRRRRAGAR